MSVERIWADLMAGNERFRTGRPQPRDLVREREAVAQAQHPKAMVLTCCDSRVAPEIIFDQRLGELFVVRLAGDVADKMAIGSLEIGAEHLHASLLIVMGHQHCGGVQAACSMHRGDSANLKAIIRAVRTSGASAGLRATDDELCGAEKQNARYIADAVLDRSDHLRNLVQRGDLTVVKAYYHLDSGAVERL
jgi:carbonic anhydrase